jgi:DNA-directed RNA polymerase sigma subunit (sigma70/sigma32)
MQDRKECNSGGNGRKGMDLMTQDEVAVLMGVSRGRIHQVEKRALEKLRDRLIDDPLIRDFLAATKAKD